VSVSSELNNREECSYAAEVVWVVPGSGFRFLWLGVPPTTGQHRAGRTPGPSRV